MPTLMYENSKKIEIVWENIYMDNEKTFLKTSDINLAAALLCCNHDVSGIDPVDPGRVIFFFDKDDSLSKDVDAYWGNTLRVSPKDYMYYRKELLTRINKTDVVGRKDW